MKMVKDKEILVGADFAGFPLKEAVVSHLKSKGWKVTDVGVRSENDNDTDLMFHRVGLRVGSMISEGEFERALVFCGTGMGIHIAASKCPHVHAGVVESVPAALRAITGNGVNVLAMGAFYVAPQMGIDIAEAYLNAELGSGYEWWHNFYEFHKLAIDELEAFDYEKYKANGFKLEHLGDYDLVLETKPED
ncbi:MAG: RpiB/LacA/LacB family sugar-phosphate isomerase [Clostridia bacterium]|nr:RpiB/LacA/LacB family sugar-phosphate isomerase [Clostridia bacterium]